MFYYTTAVGLLIVMEPVYVTHSPVTKYLLADSLKGVSPVQVLPTHVMHTKSGKSEIT